MNNAFPWTSNGLTFRTRIDLENTIDRFASTGDKECAAAARTLLAEAKADHKLSAAQYTDIKERLHL